MRLAVNPNRMELLRLRRRFQLAERGHKLLKDKLEEIMRRFLEIMRELYELQEEINEKFQKIFLSFALARARNSMREFDLLLPEGKFFLETTEEKIFNLRVPSFEVREMEVSDYDLLNTESELDIGLKKVKEVTPSLLQLARLWKAVELLAEEIDLTRRRVNALEYILIPSIKETISYISSRLEEMERSYQVQLMRVKEIVRSH